MAARRLPPGVHGPRADGRFYAVLEVGKRPDGRRDRRYVYGSSPREAADALAALRGQVATGTLPTGPNTSTKDWLEHWLTVIAAPHLRPRTREMYRWAVDKAADVIGAVPLRRLAPEHVEHLHAELLRAGLSPRSVGIVHDRLRAALNVAVRRKRLAANPVLEVSKPKVPHVEQAALERDEIVKVLESATTMPGGARWIFALAMGARQSEVLGLTWDRLDLRDDGAGVVDLSRQLQRHDGRWALVDVKSEKGRRRLPLPEPLVALLREHRRQQVETRLALGASWKGSELGELVFPTALGRPVHRSVDRKAWVGLLAAAKVRKVRVHDARHTAATVMLEEGVDLRVVQEVLGHSSYQLTANTYQHVTARLQRDAATKVGAALWPEAGQR